MMPQKEAGSIYGEYEGDQAYTRQQFETPDQHSLQEERTAKVYAPVHGNQNMLRLMAFGMALAALFGLAVLCLIFVGGVGGWISFCAATLAVIAMGSIVIDKMK
jgi:hypothetical protein